MTTTATGRSRKRTGIRRLLPSPFGSLLPSSPRARPPKLVSFRGSRSRIGRLAWRLLLNLQPRLLSLPFPHRRAEIYLTSRSVRVHKILLLLLSGGRRPVTVTKRGSVDRSSVALAPICGCEEMITPQEKPETRRSMGDVAVDPFSSLRRPRVGQ